MKCGNLNFLEPSGPLQTCNVAALPTLCASHQILVPIVFFKFLIFFTSKRATTICLIPHSLSPQYWIQTACLMLTEYNQTALCVKYKIRRFQSALCCRVIPLVKYSISIKLNDFTVWRHTWRKHRENCTVLTGNSAGFRIVLFSRLSHRELRSSLRVFYSFLSLPADTTTPSSQGTSVSSNSFSRWASHDIFLFKYHLLHILHFLFFFSDNIMADVASKQQMTALFLSTIVTRTRRHTELTKNWQTWWETCAVPENIQFSFLCSFFYTVKLHSLNLECPLFGDVNPYPFPSICDNS